MTTSKTAEQLMEQVSGYGVAVQGWSLSDTNTRANHYILGVDGDSAIEDVREALEIGADVAVSGIDAGEAVDIYATAWDNSWDQGGNPFPREEHEGIEYVKVIITRPARGMLAGGVTEYIVPVNGW